MLAADPSISMQAARESVISTSAVARVCQRDIARRLGVSHATVSLALRDHPRISIATREEVKRIAGELGYQPTPSLRIFSNHSCFKKRSYKLAPLGWINAWSAPGQLVKHHEYGGYWRGACEAASRMGYRLEEFRIHSGTTAKELKQRLRAASFHGLLLPPGGDLPALEHFPWEKHHVVSLSHYTVAPAIPLVAPDRVGNCSLAFKMMRNRGYRRIGFLTDRFPETIHDKLSVAGFLATQCESPAEEHLPVFTTEDHPLPPQLSQWVAEHRPDAILTDLPDAALLLKRAGIRIPHDLGLAFSCRSRALDSAGIDCHPEEVGRTGVEMLRRAIDGFLMDDPKIRVAVNGHWRDGRTLPSRVDAH
jgi:DNA-binding LacI/PurR family transcriptional regulator